MYGACNRQAEIHHESGDELDARMPAMNRARHQLPRQTPIHQSNPPA